MLASCTLIARAQAVAGFVLEIEMANAKGGVVQLFYNTGYSYNQHDSATETLPPSESLQLLRFHIPAAPIKHLRLDPDIGAATVRIGRFRLLTDDGRLLRQFGAEQVRAMYDIRSLSIDHGIALVQTGNTDPMLLIDEPLHALTERALGRRTLTTPAILALGVAGLAGMGLALLAAVRAASGGNAPTRPLLWIFLGVTLIVAGGRLFWLLEYSRPIPFWDEWDSDALFLLIPWRGGFLDWQALVIPQSEHRIVITRLVTLIGTILNGDWDPRLGMVVSTFMAAASLGILATFAARAGTWVALAATALLTAAAVLPFDYDNLLWGGQSQMYALNFFALVCLAIAAAPRIDGWTMVGSVTGGFLSLASMGAGFVAPGLAAAVCGFRAWREPHARGRLLMLAACFTVITVLGLAWHEASHWHEPSYAHSLAEFWGAFAYYAAWPFPGHHVATLVLWLPWLTLVLLTARSRQNGPLTWFAVMTGCWALVTAVALAYGRPRDLPPIQPKYFTALSVAGFAAILAAVALAVRLRSRWRKIIPLAAATAIAVAFVAVGIQGIAGARRHRELKNYHDDLVRHYLATGDRASMQDVPPWRSPYWNSAELAERLDSPLLQPLLPPALRAALNARGGNHFDPTPGPLSLAARALMKAGAALAAVGIAICTLGWIRRRKTVRAEFAK